MASGSQLLNGASIYCPKVIAIVALVGGDNEALSRLCLKVGDINRDKHQRFHHFLGQLAR